MTWNNLLNQTLKRFAALQKETPASFAGFEMMGKATKASGALDVKSKSSLPWVLPFRHAAKAA
jgi:hypothetical protein